MAVTVTAREWRPLIAEMAMVAVIIAVGIGDVEAQSTPPGSSGCTNTIVSLSPCLTYITGNNSDSKPPQGCCSALGTVVKNSVGCLCQLFSSNSPVGIPVNRTRALSLPGACHIKTPPVSQCTESNRTSYGGNIPLTPGPIVDGSSGGSTGYRPSVVVGLIGLILLKFVW